jgi:signal recognition particle subunit SEC65
MFYFDHHRPRRRFRRKPAQLGIQPPSSREIHPAQYNRGVRVGALLAIACGAASLYAANPPDAREIIRRCVNLDQSNWMRRKDYTWNARETTRHLDSSGQLKSTDSEAWETLILFGKPYRKTTERDGQPLSSSEQQKEQQKIDRAVAQLERETPEQRAARLAQEQKERTKDFEFLNEMPDAFNFQIAGEEKIDGRDTWVISAQPNLNYHPKHGDAKAFQKIEGRIWIDKAESQWVRIEAKTTGVISWGWFLARLDPGASLALEQTRVNDEIWLPRREFLSGAGRLGILKKLREEQEVIWTNYRKFQVDSTLVPTH